MFVVVHDPENPEESWKLKRDIQLIRETLDVALDKESVNETDQVIFTYRKNTYNAIAKVIFVTPRILPEIPPQ